MIVQRKLNGVRMMYANGLMMSRDRVAWNTQCLSHLRLALADVPKNVILDGELYFHGMSLQQINSRVAVTRVGPHEDEGRIEYWVFDLVSEEPQYVRLKRLEEILGQGSRFVKVVPSKYCGTRDEAEAEFVEYKREGFEGAIFRAPNKPYALRDLLGRKTLRVDWMLKRKDWLDLEARIVGMVEGEGRLEGTLGALVLKTVNQEGKFVEFRAGSGLDDIERDTIWRNQEKFMGHLVKVKYEWWSDEGKPLKPTIIQVYNL